MIGISVFATRLMGVAGPEPVQAQSAAPEDRLATANAPSDLRALFPVKILLSESGDLPGFTGETVEV